MIWRNKKSGASCCDNYRKPGVRGHSSFLLLTLAIAAVPLVLTFSSCGIYSFQGATTNARNISIQEFFNNTDLGPANLAQMFTNKIKDYFIQNTNLSVVQSNGELQLEGVITEYRLSQIAPSAATRTQTGLDAAASSRLTITVRVTYVNALDESMSFKDKSFSFYRDFSNDLNFTDIEDSLIRQIFDQLALDIFNASVANW